MDSPSPKYRLAILDEAESPESLAIRYKQGDDSTLGALYRTTSVQVQQLFAKYVPDDLDRAIDLTQKFYKELKNSLSTYTDSRLRLRTWLVTATREFWLKEQPVAETTDDIALTQEQCPYNIGREKCDKVNAVTEGAWSVASCSNCNLPIIAEQLALACTQESFAALHVIGLSLESVHSLPISQGDNSQNQINCPILNVEIVEPCLLKSCSYNIDYPWSKNCLLQYIATHEPTCKVPEIAMLLNLPVKRVQTVLDNALGIMRGSALNKSYESGELDYDFEYLSHDNICVVCEEPVPNLNKAILVEELTYCSKSCFRRRSPHHVRVEKRYKNTWRTVLRQAKQKFPTKADAYKAVGLPYVEGQSVESDTENAQIKRRTGVRPAWLRDLEKGVTKRLRKLGIQDPVRL